MAGVSVEQVQTGQAGKQGAEGGSQDDRPFPAFPAQSEAAETKFERYELVDHQQGTHPGQTERGKEQNQGQCLGERQKIRRNAWEKISITAGEESSSPHLGTEEREKNQEQPRTVIVLL
jgi:hypothetical protein